MSLGKDVAKVEAETEDELEQIMNDIENLQEEMASEEEAERKRRAQQEPARPALRAVPGGAEEDSEPAADFAATAETDAELEAAVAAEVEAEAEVASELSDFRGTADDASLEETLAALEQEEAAEGSLLSSSALTESIDDGVETTDSETVAEVPAATETETEPSRVRPMEATVNHLKPRAVAPTPRATSGTTQDGAMTLSVSGAMTLKLRYENADQEVEVALTSDTLTVRLADGTEFRVPIQGRRAA